MGAALLLAVFLAIVLISISTKEKAVLEYSDKYVAMAELPSQLSFTYFGEEEWKEKVKAVNGGEDLNGKLTYGKLGRLLEQLSVQDYVEYEGEVSWKEVSRAQWDGIYSQVLDLLDVEGRVSLRNFVFLEKDTDNPQDAEGEAIQEGQDSEGEEGQEGQDLEGERSQEGQDSEEEENQEEQSPEGEGSQEGQDSEGEGSQEGQDSEGKGSQEGQDLEGEAEESGQEAGEEPGGLRKLTQEGYYEVAKGVDYFHYYDMYQAYVMDGRIIGIKGRCQEPVTLKNVFVHTAGEGQAAILFEGREIPLDVEGLNEEIRDTICDMEWKGGKVSAVYKKEDVISGKVLSFDDEKIEISGYGALKHSGNLKIYKTYGTVEQLDESKLLVGNLKADFVVAEKDVCGIILKEPASMDNIRVLLLNGENGIFHGDPMFVADAGCTVTVGDTKKKIKKNKLIRVSEYFGDGEGYVKVSMKKKDGRFYFSNGDKEHISLGYRGTLEIRKYPEGYGVVNELPLEQYLYGVVPSEMPASYDRQALCVQAVCARSYAYIQLLNNSYAAYGAHVDDSTSYQVYNKQQEDPKTNLAVDDTVGEVIKYQGEVAEAYFFSTSCGYTQDIGVWNLPEDEAHGYLKGIPLVTEGGTSDLSKEDAFEAFIQGKEVQAYDSDSPYFRWEAVLDTKGKLEAINGAIVSRAQANGGNVLFVKGDGSPGTEGDLPGFGKIVGIEAKEREAGGCLRRLCISYEKGSVELLTEYNIRFVLGAAAVQVTDQEGNPVDMSLLPSACCMAAPEKEGFHVFGGGYGHGLGMSQNGANGMAKAGMGYVEILKEFYHDIAIENIYNGD